MPDQPNLNDFMKTKVGSSFGKQSSGIDHNRDNWRLARLEDVAPTQSSNVQDLEPLKKYNYISLENIESNTGRLVAFSPTLGSKIKSSKTAFTKNHVLYGKLRPYLNKVFVPDFDGICTTELIPLLPKPAILSKDFLAWQMRTPQFVAYAMSNLTGTRMPRVSMEALKNARIPVPPLDVQKSIVARIEQLTSRIDQVKNLREEALNDTEATIQAALHKILSEGEKEGWEWKILGDVLRSVRYGISRKANNEGRGYPIIRMINIKNGTIDYSDMKFVELEENEASNYFLKIGDILINRTNSYELVGKSGLFDRTSQHVYASYLIRLRVDETKADPDYINWIINSRIGKNYVSKTCRRAIQQANINAEEIKKMPIPLPSLERQKQVTAFLDSLRHKTESLERYQEETLVEIDSFTQAVLTMAFCGKLLKSC